MGEKIVGISTVDFMIKLDELVEAANAHTRMIDTCLAAEKNCPPHYFRKVCKIPESGRGLAKQAAEELVAGCDPDQVGNRIVYEENGAGMLVRAYYTLEGDPRGVIRETRIEFFKQ